MQAIRLEDGGQSRKEGQTQPLWKAAKPSGRGYAGVLSPWAATLMRLFSSVPVFARPSSKEFGRVPAAGTRCLFKVTTNRRLQLYRTVCLWLSFLALSIPAVCIDRDRRLDQLRHTAWTAKDGAPAAVRALAQTTDGYLWLGTESGLFRFDGVRFEAYSSVSGVTLPDPDISALLAVPDGGLWIGSGSGDISLLRPGKLINYGRQSGLFGHSISAFCKDRQGRLWIADAGLGLLLFDGKQLKKIGADWNFYGNPYSVFEDDQGTLWVGSRDRVEYLQAGQNHFQLASEGLQNVHSLAESRDGTIWMADLGRAVRPVPKPHMDAKQLQSEIVVGSLGILFDHQGSLWIGTVGDGLRRLPTPEKLDGQKVAKFSDAAEMFTQKNGLSSDYVRCILQDREGNVWAGTNSGIDRFQQSAIVPVELPPGTSELTLTPLENGAIQVASANKNLMQIVAGKAITLPEGVVVTNGFRIKDGFIVEYSYARETPESLRRTLNPNVNYGTTDRPVFFERTQIFTMPHLYHPGTGTLTDAIKNGASIIRAATTDAEGRKWYSISGIGVFRVGEKGWTSLESLGGPKGNATSAFKDANGRVWFGFQDTVVLLDSQNVRRFSTKDGIAVGNVWCIQDGLPGLWIAGPTGVSFFDGTRFRSLLSATDQVFTGVHGMIVSRGQGMWLASARGIVSIPEQELQAFRKNPEYRVKARIFDSLDGLPDDIQRTAIDSSAVQGTDGKLWFATTQGVVWVDPENVPSNKLPPPVAIEYLTADQRRYDLVSPVRLPPHIGSLQIHYAALSLSVPERVRFRYRLEGVDRGWQDVETRRDAYYTNLGPGSYTFDVIACNEDGVWNNTGATSVFVIAPAFYQTWWWALLCAFVTAAALWGLHLYRIRLATAQIQTRVGAQLEERERIARELHDTLLQGFHGLMLRFQAVMKILLLKGPRER